MGVCLNIVIGKCLSGCFVINFYVCVVLIKLKKKEKKLNVLICIEFGLYFKKYQKYFSFGIGDHNLIRKMHYRY